MSEDSTLASQSAGRIEPWSDADTQSLKEGIKTLERQEGGTLKHGEFKKLAFSLFPGRSYNEVYRRYRELCKPREAWTLDSDARLLAAVVKHGKNWKHIQKNVFPQCETRRLKLRYESCLDPELKQGPLLQEEEMQIFMFELGYSELKSRSDFARSIKRTENDCKNFWNSTVESSVKELKTFDEAWKTWKASPKRAKWIERGRRKANRQSLPPISLSSSSSLSTMSVTSEGSELQVAKSTKKRSRTSSNDEPSVGEKKANIDSDAYRTTSRGTSTIIRTDSSSTTQMVDVEPTNSEFGSDQRFPSVMDWGIVGILRQEILPRSRSNSMASPPSSPRVISRDERDLQGFGFVRDVGVRTRTPSFVISPLFQIVSGPRLTSLSPASSFEAIEEGPARPSSVLGDFPFV